MSLPFTASTSSTPSHRKKKPKRFHDTTTPLSILVQPTNATLFSSPSESSLSLDSRATNNRSICKYSTNLPKKRTFCFTHESLHPILRDKFVSESLMDLTNGTRKLADIRLIRRVAINGFSTVMKYWSNNQSPLAKSKHSDSSLSSPTRKNVRLTQFF